MRQVKIFKFSELSEEAQAVAIEEARDRFRSSSYIPWQEEILDSFKEVFKIAGIGLRDYSLGMCSSSYVKIDLDKSDPVYNLAGVRALTWIENNFLSKLRVSHADYVKNRKNYFRYGYRVGKVKDCPLTGYCADEDFIQTLIDSAKSGDCLGEIFQIRLAETCVKLIESEYQNQLEEEVIREDLEINSYEFLESGKLF